MDLRSGLAVGRIRGITIRLHWSWLIVAAVLTWSFATGLYRDLFMDWSASQRWTAAAVTSVLFFVSVLLHELSHAVVAQRFGMVVASITLFVFGGVSSLVGEMRSARQEFAVAIAGPLMSWALAVVFGVAWFASSGDGPRGVFGYLAWINGALGLFNLLPGFPLDGGRVLRAFVWGRTKSIVRATRFASRVGTGIAYAMIAAGLLVVVVFGLYSGVWYVLIGLFLRAASSAAYPALMADRALRGVSVASVMHTPPAPVDGSMSVQRLVDDRILRSFERAFLVSDGTSVIGLLTAADVAKLPREEWATASVRRIMTPVERVVTVTTAMSLLDAMQLMRDHDVDQLPVLADGRVAGMLTRADLQRQIEVRTHLVEGHRQAD